MIKNQEKPEELIRAEKLIDDGKFEEALQIIDNLLKKISPSDQDRMSSNLLRCTLLNRLGQFQDALKLAESICQESKVVGKQLQLIDLFIEMSESLMYLGRWEKALETILKCEDILMAITQISAEELKQREASIAFVKGLIFGENGDLDSGLKYTERSLLLQRKFGNKQDVARCLTQMGYVLYYKGVYGQMSEYLEESLKLEENCFNRNVLATLILMGHVIIRRESSKRGLEYYKQSLEHAMKMNAKDIIAWCFLCIGHNYMLQGNLDNALNYLKRSLTLYDDIGHNFWIFNVLDSLFHLSIDMNSNEQAQYFLHRMKEIKERDKSKVINLGYRVDKAVMVKTSLRSSDRSKAEEILKKVVEEEIINTDYTLIALLNLCDLLLFELRITSDLEVFGELQSYITRLMDIAEKNRTYWLLAETYLLQAKLSLLTFNIKKAQRFLTQAQQIAERFNLNQLVSKIANEKEDLLKKLDLWDKLKEVGAPMADRFDLARLDEQIAGMVKNRAVLTAQVTEDKVTIHKEKKICLVCRGEVLRYTYICECGAIYCENCARALTNLENMCWACDVPIDYSKPVKPRKEETEELGIDKKHKTS